MKINRHNYEEYFLLYIDSELTAEQERQVDLFVKENPDLEEELVMLQQSKLLPDNSIVFEKKDLLMKNEDHSFINLNNYEEWLVLYVDDELSEEEKMEVERFAASHLHVQQELKLFRQTKLQPEEIVFDDKEILYRREKVTVISMQWWKVAVAAILIIAAGITLYSIFKKSNSDKGRMEIVKIKTIANPVSNAKKTPDQVNSSATDKKEQNTIKEKEQVAAAVPFNKKQVKENAQKKLAPEENNQQLADNSSLPGNEKTIKAKPIASDVSEITTEPQLNSTVFIGDKVHKENFNRDSVTKHQPETPQPIYASNDTENKKLRGFFRKATRLIERTTSINPANDDNKVLIGGMAFNLK